MVSCTAKTIDDGALRDAIKPTDLTKELFLPSKCNLIYAHKKSMAFPEPMFMTLTNNIIRRSDTETNPNPMIKVASRFTN